MNGLWTEEALQVVQVLPDVPQDPLNPPTLADIRAYLEAEGLAKYEWPERLELIDELPRTQVGKISKVALRADISAKLEHETTE